MVCSASYETRKFGVRSAMPISRALRLCPEAMCVPVPRRACAREAPRDPRRPRAVHARRPGREHRRVVPGPRRHGAAVRRCVAGGRSRIGSATRSSRSDGLSVSLGGGTSKLVAKLAVERAKPKPGTGADGVHVVEPGEELAFMRQLDARRHPRHRPQVIGSGSPTLGLRRVEDVLALDARRARSAGRRARCRLAREPRARRSTTARSPSATSRRASAATRRSTPTCTTTCCSRAS